MLFSQLNELFHHFRLTLSLTVILVMLGAVGFVVISKEEDPHLANRYGSITVIYPGADSEKIQSNVMVPLEKKLRTITSIKIIETRIRSQFSYMYIELKDNVTDIEKEWNEIDRILSEQRLKFPRGVSDVKLDRDAIDLEAIIVSIQGVTDSLTLGREGLKFKQYLESISGVREVKMHGDPKIGMDIDVDSVELARRGLTLGQLIQQVERSNLHLSAGSYEGQSPFVQLMVKNSIDDVNDLRALPILYPRMTAAPLGEIAKIQYGVKKNQDSRARVNGDEAIILGLVPEHPMDIIRWGESVKNSITNYQKNNPHLKLSYITYQPSRTLDRINDLAISLLEGMVLVIVVLGLWMGWRIGLVVALSVPMISMIGFGVYYLGGGVLHQISLAALLLSLGQFIDNVTVIAEGTQRRIDEGKNSVEAALETARQFKIPMIFATGTAVASFLPLLSSEGATAEFTIAIPIIAVITLLVSYFFSIYTTPLFCALLLRPQTKRQKIHVSNILLEKIYAHPKMIVLGTAIIFLLSATGLVFVKKEFFPGADRNEFTLTLEMPEGTSIEDTDRYARLIESELKQRKDLLQFSTYVGQTTPYYYYSVRPETNISHVAEFLLTTKDFARNLEVANSIITKVRTKLPASARISHRQLKQGAPVKADIEFEVYGDNLKELSDFAHEFISHNKRLEGAVNIRTSAPLFVPSIKVELKEEEALEKNFDRNQLALNILAFTQGIEISHYFDDGERLPMRISLTDSGQNKNWERTSRLKIIPTTYRDYSLAELTKTKELHTPTVIDRKNGRMMISILADLVPGYGFNQVGPVIETNLHKAISHKNWEIKVAGQEGESSTANLAILRALPFGLILLLVCLLLEFRSFRKLLLVMISVGLVSLGVTPGLLIGNQPFGFMSLLGILALVGIVVNNAILIIEAIEEVKITEPDLTLAIRKALLLRTRPILMTTIMTLLGLLPLAFENSTLWPPMAWAMISGLVISTVMSLFFLPASYELLFQREGISGIRKSVAVVIASFTLLIPMSWAREYDLAELINQADQTDQWIANENLNQADEFESKGIWRSAFLPKLSGSVERVMNDRVLFLEGGSGLIPYGRIAYNVGGLILEQPIIHPGTMFYGFSSVEKKAQAQKETRSFENEKIRLDLLIGGLSILQILEQIDLQKKLIENLNLQYKEVERLFRQGKTGRSDLAKIEVEQVKISRLIIELQERQNEIKEKIRIHFSDFETVKLKSINFFAQKDDPFFQGRSTKGSLRGDIRSVELLISSFEDAYGAAKASYLPRLSLLGRYNNTDQGFLVKNQAWYSLSLQLQWSIFDGGVQMAEKNRYLLQQRAFEHSRRALVREQEAEEKNFSREILRLKADEETYAKTEQKVRMILKDERLYYKVGKITLNQVLETERLWIEQKIKYIDSVFNRWKKGVEYLYSQGIVIDEKIFQ
jgi:multidrug efflux pump subunit AcrB/outer membrane protein TolC